MSPLRQLNRTYPAVVWLNLPPIQARRVGALGVGGHLKVGAEARQLLLAIVLRENPPWHVAVDDIERPATAAIKAAFAETSCRQGRGGQDVALQVGIAERDDRIAVRRDGGEPWPELQRVAPRALLDQGLP
jgi:hypothetical protein